MIERASYNNKETWISEWVEGVLHKCRKISLLDLFCEVLTVLGFGLFLWPRFDVFVSQHFLMRHLVSIASLLLWPRFNKVCRIYPTCTQSHVIPVRRPLLLGRIGVTSKQYFGQKIIFLHIRHPPLPSFQQLSWLLFSRPHRVVRKIITYYRPPIQRKTKKWTWQAALT